MMSDDDAACLRPEPQRYRRQLIRLRRASYDEPTRHDDASEMR